MGLNRFSWSTAVTVLTTLLHIQGVVSVTTMTVTGLEGHTLSFKRNYTQKSTSTYFLKYFYRVDNNTSDNHLIVTKQPDELLRNGRFSLYDNLAEACVLVSVDKASPEDSGTYWCGVDVSSHPDDITVIQLTVVPDSSDVLLNSEMIPSVDSPVFQVNHPLFFTAVMCVAAMLFVCVFTLCLLLSVKHRRAAQTLNRQMSADYETMMPSVRNQPEPCCTCPDCVEFSALSSPPRGVCASFRSKQRESAISEYAVVSVREHSCQDQCLDVSQIEEKVYEDLGGVKDEKK